MRPYIIRSCLFLALSMIAPGCEGPHGIAVLKKTDCHHAAPAGREELQLSSHPVDGIVELY